MILFSAKTLPLSTLRTSTVLVMNITTSNHI